MTSVFTKEEMLEIQRQWEVWKGQNQRVQAMFFGDFLPDTSRELTKMLQMVDDYETIKSLRAEPTEMFNGLRNATKALGAVLIKLKDTSDRIEVLDLMHQLIKVMVWREKDRLDELRAPSHKKAT